MEELKMKKEVINSVNAPAAVGPYVQAVKVGDFIFTSGQLGIDPATGNIPEGVTEQANLSLKNLGAILKEAGMDYGNVIKTTVFLKEMNDFATINAIYAEYFKGEVPARSCVEVAKLPKGGLIEIEAIAVKN